MCLCACGWEWELNWVARNELYLSSIQQQALVNMDFPHITLLTLLQKLFFIPIAIPGSSEFCIDKKAIWVGRPLSRMGQAKLPFSLSSIRGAPWMEEGEERQFHLFSLHPPQFALYLLMWISLVKELSSQDWNRLLGKGEDPCINTWLHIPMGGMKRIHRLKKKGHLCH